MTGAAKDAFWHVSTFLLLGWNLVTAEGLWLVIVAVMSVALTIGTAYQAYWAERLIVTQREGLEIRDRTIEHYRKEAKP